MDRQYITLCAATAGLITIVLGVILLLIFPASAELSDGFRTPIIAFEFAQSEADLVFLAGDDALSQLNREKMDQGHRWDMAFPVAYGSFLALLLIQTAQAGFRPGWPFVLVALLAIPFDIWENSILIEITADLRNGGSGISLLGQLHVATWLKWGAIGVSAGVIGVAHWQNNEYWSAGVGIITVLITAVCWLRDSDPVCVEIMSLLVFLFFLWFVVKQCLLVRNQILDSKSTL